MCLSRAVTMWSTHSTIPLLTSNIPLGSSVFFPQKASKRHMVKSCTPQSFLLVLQSRGVSWGNLELNSNNSLEQFYNLLRASWKVCPVVSSCIVSSCKVFVLVFLYLEVKYIFESPSSLANEICMLGFLVSLFSHQVWLVLTQTR